MNTKEQLMALRESGLTQKEIAEMVGIEQPTISRLMSGIIADPKTSTSKKIEAIFNTLQKSA